MNLNPIHSHKHLKQNRISLRTNSTPQEGILWSKLRKNNLGFRFPRQHSIGNYIVDFYCPTKKLIIEIDGIQHDDKKDKEYDLERTKYFESLEYKVLRFWNNEISTNIEGVVLKIMKYLE